MLPIADDADIKRGKIKSHTDRSKVERDRVLKQKPRPSVSHGGFDQAATQPYQYDAQHNAQDQVG